MKTIAAILLLVVAGCGDSNPHPGDGGSAASPDLAVPMCTRTCPACPTGQTCFVPGATSEFRAFCAQACSVSSDCGGPGERCAKVFNEPSQPRVCVSQTSPLPCEGEPAQPNFHCDQPPATCMNSQILQAPFSQQANLLCGVEYSFCPTGCAPGDADAGVAAHCN
jgi:hypothetical protein